MSADYQSIPHANVFGLGRHSHGVIFDEFNVSRLSAAAQGLQTILAVLHQRELDAETLNADGVSFGHEVALGLLAAAGTCANTLETAIDGGGGAAHAFHGSTAYDHLVTARKKVMDDKYTPATSKKRGATGRSTGVLKQRLTGEQK